MISPSTRTRRARPFDIVRQKCGMLLGRDVLIRARICKGLQCRAGPREKPRLRVESRSDAVDVGSALTVSDPFGCRCLII
jgi:hypothetical protein